MNTTARKVGAPAELAPDDASIPVLTERLTLPPLELDTTLPKEIPEEPAPARAAAAPAAARPTPAASADASEPAAHWTRIEVELRASILRTLSDSLPQEVDAIVRSRMNDAIDRMLAQLVAETRLAMAASLRDIVDHAVRTELTRLRAQKR
jgi:hypothetical protein